MIRWHLNHAEHGDKPWPVQAEALKRAEGRRGYIWFLEQGLGKTSLALNHYVDAFENDEVDVCIVVCPNSFKSDWPLAPNEWGVPSIRTGSWPKSPLPTEIPALYSINFEAARDSAFKTLLDYIKSHRVLLVIDESLALANPSSLTSKRMIELCKHATQVRELNGTPTTEGVMDLYAQLRCVGEADGLNQWGFRNRYAKLGGYMGKKVVGRNPATEDELARILNRCSFRALKSEWRKDLPEKIYSAVHLDMTPAQQKHYRMMQQEFYTQIRGHGVAAEMVMIQIDKLRQIASGLLVDKDKYMWIVPPNKNPKIQAAVELHNATRRKSIVVYTYRPMLEALMEAYKKNGDNPVYIRGSMKPAELLENKRRFNDDSSCRVIVCQESAAFRGHTLIGRPGDDRCSRMIFVENDLSYYHRCQMEDRNHRGAQDEPCTYYDLLASKTCEMALRLLRKKRDDAEGLDHIVAAFAGKNATDEDREFLNELIGK